MLFSSMVGALQYLTITRHDLTYAVNVSQHMQSRTVPYFQALKRILRYVKGTFTMVSSSSSTSLTAYPDTD